MISSTINFSHTSCSSLALEEVNISESTNFLTCTLGSYRSISSLRLVTLDGIYPRGKAAVSLRSGTGNQSVELCYEPEMYGIQQIDSVDEETLLLFTSKTDKACLRDLFDSHCFTGDAKKQVHDFCFT